MFLNGGGIEIHSDSYEIQYPVVIRLFQVVQSVIFDTLDVVCGQICQNSCISSLIRNNTAEHKTYRGAVFIGQITIFVGYARNMAVKILDRPGIGGNLFGTIRFHGSESYGIGRALDRNVVIDVAYSAGNVFDLDLLASRSDTRTRYFKLIGLIGCDVS